MFKRKNNLKFFTKRFGGLKIRVFLCTPNHKKFPIEKSDSDELKMVNERS
jgi:hypothetical protein